MWLKDVGHIAVIILTNWRFLGNASFQISKDFWIPTGKKNFITLPLYPIGFFFRSWHHFLFLDNIERNSRKKKKKTVNTLENSMETRAFAEKFWILWKILWKIEHLLKMSKCSIFHFFFKYRVYFKGIKRCYSGVKGKSQNPIISIFHLVMRLALPILTDI